MTNEELAKDVGKFIIDKGNQNLTDFDKELMKQAVDRSNNWQELMTILMISKMK